MRVACILAAGLGSRLKSLTRGAAKCMVNVNGRPLVDHLLDCLDKLDYDKYVFVIGHKGEKLREFLSKHWQRIEFIDNPVYNKTNNIFSLYLASRRLADFDEIHLFESDVWVRPDILINYLSAPAPNGSVLVSPYEYWMDGTSVTLEEDRKVSGFILKTDVHHYTRGQLYKTVNVYKFRGDFFRSMYVPFIEAYIKTQGSSSYYEDVLRVLAPIESFRLEGFIIPPDTWMEIDDAEDLRRAAIFSASALNTRHAALMAQYGGYWKSSNLTDLTLPTNPYFPTPEFMAEFNQETANAIGNYPSTQSVIAGIAAKSCDFEHDQIAVGNGASELLQALFSCVTGAVAICPPTFLEYERLLGHRVRHIKRSFPRDSFRATLLAYATSSETHLAIINPNNPTGEWLDRDDVLSIAKTQASHNKMLLVDESFADFGPGVSCAERDLLYQHPNLIILRSYGKSHGVGGLRLGLLFSTNTELVKSVRAALPIWNVSAFAEIFLDLLPKYKSQFEASLIKVRGDRERLAERLRALGFAIAPSAANFLLVQIPEGVRDRAAEVFLKNGLLIKIIERDGLEGLHVRIPVKGAGLDARICQAFDELL
jgi:histidinol-phosphate/aromatic aminotransferase/cobyric acid decarboxylase-like protein/choline kinase